ncbi:hypothetical protein M9H77_08459 [Catharanthus roseus]|uniref:Uncharacterized protein n=1 Tax=Catharanthus roseus TaxID=4058 RepID=A0ACC0BXV6_CATRO|nr:hypothetical protein M9H77_08459 [Catharanthus roseus]
MHNFHHGGDSRFNDFGGNNHGNPNFTPRRHFRDGNFSSYAKSFENTSYDNYGGYGKVNTRYDNYEHRVEDKGRNLEKELGNYLKDLAINLSLNPSLICSEVSFVELELFLECIYVKESEFIKAIEKDELVSLLNCKEEIGGLSPLRKMEHQIKLQDCKVLDLPPTIGPAPTVPGSLLALVSSRFFLSN